MTAAGLAAFAARDEARAKKYSFERARSAFDRVQQRAFKANPRAWAFFQAQPPGYRKVATFYVVSAKQEETRARRLAALIEACTRERRIGLLAPKKSS